MCWLFGYSRQAYYKHYKEVDKDSKANTLVLDLVTDTRLTHPRIGVRKMYYMLQKQMEAHQVKLGRDAMFDLLREEGLLIRKRRRKAITTWSGHPYRKYPNLIKSFVPSAPNKLWVSDITYLRTQKGFAYLSLITDAYSSKIVGYDIATNLEAVNSLNALKMALMNNANNLNGLIHHSDRGLQYCSHEYVRLLQQHNIRISMTESGDPLENPKAERINGILKQEYMYKHTIRDINHARKLLYATVEIYNTQRPHLSCDMLTPEQIHNQSQTPKRLWKTYYRKKATIVNPVQD